MKPYLWYAFSLLVAGIVFVLVYGLAMIPVMAAVAGAWKLYEKIAKPLIRTALKIIIYPMIGVGAVGHLYVFSAWAAYIVLRTWVLVNQPTVTHRWLYFLTAFFAWTGPIGFMWSKENGVEKWTAIAVTTGLVVFIVFALRPQLAIALYPWVWNWVK